MRVRRILVACGLAWCSWAPQSHADHLALSSSRDDETLRRYCRSASRQLHKEATPRPRDSSLNVWRTAIAKALGIGRASVYRVLEAGVVAGALAAASLRQITLSLQPPFITFSLNFR